jgi:hypothetical protein
MAVRKPCGNRQRARGDIRRPASFDDKADGRSDSVAISGKIELRGKY